MTQAAQPAPPTADQAGKGKTVGVLLGIAVLSLILGYIVLTIIDFLLDEIWLEYAAHTTGVTLWVLVLGVPTIAGILVALMRQHGSDGHNPLGGIALNPVTTREYPTVIGAIAVTLVGGLVLGPEVAMVSTGAWVGTTIATRTGIKLKAGMGMGALFAILALVVNPLLQGSFETSPRYEFAVANLVGAVGVGAATAGLLAIGRFISVGFLKLHGGDRPRIHILALAGFLVGVVALAYYYLADQPVGLVLTSGESNVLQMLELGSVGVIALTVIGKLLAYSISMGGGFRGGPFFPAIYVGAGMGAIALLLNHDFGFGSSAAGIAAACVYLAHPSWKSVVAIGVVVGLIAGGWQLIPIAVVGALVAKLLPAINVQTKPTGEEEISEVR